MFQTFGSFIDGDEAATCLALTFSSTLLPVQAHWRNNSLAANFIANYVEIFLQAVSLPDIGLKDQIASVVSYIANELLENAVKFHAQDALKPISFSVAVTDQFLRFYATNYVHLQQAERFQQLIQKILREDPETLYLRQLEENAQKGSENTESRLGLLTIRHDYEAQLAWQFVSMPQDADQIAVTTMVQLAFQTPRMAVG